MYSNAYDITINADDDIYLTGYYRGLLRIEDLVFQSTVPDYYDICVLKFDKKGDFGWLKSFGGDSPMNDIGYGITFYENDIYIAGMYSSNSWFDKNYLNCNGASDVFIVKLSDLTNSNTIIEKQNEEISIYPNPFSSNIFVKFKSPKIYYQLKLYNSFSQEIYSKNITDIDFTTIELSNYPSGIYFLQIHNPEKNSTINKKLIKY